MTDDLDFELVDDEAPADAEPVDEAPEPPKDDTVPEGDN